MHDSRIDEPIWKQIPSLDNHELSNLPPLTLHIILPQEYPVISISITPQLLGQAVIRH